MWSTFPKAFNVLCIIPFIRPGGYYLTSVYASLCVIQNLDREKPVSGFMTPQAQEALQEWSSRRSREALRQKENQQSQVCTTELAVYHCITRSRLKHIVWKHSTSEYFNCKFKVAHISNGTGLKQTV